MFRSIGKFKYQTPESLPEVLKILETSTLTRKILAGGTDLILQMKQGIVRPSLVVDVKQVPELNQTGMEPAERDCASGPLYP